MALSQLRPMVIEGDRPAPVAPQSGFTRLPDGSLIMRGAPKAIEKPGMLAGLRQLIASKLSPAPAQDQWWIPQAAPAAPVAAAPAPVVAGPGTPLPAYNDPWGEIEAKAAEQQRVKEELEGVSRAVMNSPALIEGKWMGGR